jgi:hypothetical protein
VGFGRPPHQAQSLLDPIFGNQIQVRRLLELYLQALAQGIVKDRIGGVVGEIGNQDGILGIKGAGPMRVQQ